MATDYDVLVVGGGGAGMTAALMAEAEGARVAILEAGDKLGGSTALSGGVVWAAGTSVQRAAGIEDNAEDAYRYYLVLNQYKVEPELVRVLCDRGPEAVEFLVENGVRFLPENLYQSGVDGIKRGHRPVGAGAEIAEVLDRLVSQRPIDIAYRSRVSALIRRADGGVAGVIANGEEIRAGAVVLATGGYGANPELLARYYPEAAAHGDWTWYIGSKLSRGDAFGLVEPFGAEIAGFNRGQLGMTPGFVKQMEVYPPYWLVYVNRDGRRFAAETTEYACMSGLVKDQPAGECFAIFDEAARLQCKVPPQTVKNPWGSTWEAERLAELTKANRIFSAETIEELGEKAGLRPSTLRTTIDRYNADVEAGADTQFFKAREHLRPVRTAPFYAARLRPAMIGLTSTGPRIDPKARVLRRDDKPIPSLFAAGEATGGVLGERYCAGGNSIVNALVFGRIAGTEAARLALGRPNS